MKDVSIINVGRIMKVNAFEHRQSPRGSSAGIAPIAGRLGTLRYELVRLNGATTRARGRSKLAVWRRFFDISPS